MYLRHPEAEEGRLGQRRGERTCHRGGNIRVVKDERVPMITKG